MLQESYFLVSGECHYMAHSSLRAGQPTLLIIHGLGDAGQSYLDFITDNFLPDYNILIPDLLGYGKSSAAKNYSFAHQLSGLLQHINYLKQQYHITWSDFILLSHSMGGIHATLLCESVLKEHIRYFINVEGSITQFGAFISAQVATAACENNFAAWFEDFKVNKVFALATQHPALQRYFAALQFCHPAAFAQNALEMQQMCHAVPGPYTHLIGQKYRNLTTPRLYCYGDSMSTDTIAFLQLHHLPHRHLPFTSHFFMPDGYQAIVEIIKQI